MVQSKNYYVSAVVGKLDVGLAVEAPNVYMAVLKAAEKMADDGLRYADINITDVEEVKDDQ